MNKVPVIVLFDGHCHLCHWAVKFLLKNERHPLLKFAPLQSEVGRTLAPEYQSLNTVVVSRPQGLLVRSDALVFLASYLRMPWALLRFAYYLPNFMRNTLYRLVDQVRYPLFGRSEVCSLPTGMDENRLVELNDLLSPEQLER